MVLNKSAKLSDEEQLWRISSLTAFVDNETKILLLPLAESKRQTKIIDTKYEIDTVKDLIEAKSKIEKTLSVDK